MRLPAPLLALLACGCAGLRTAPAQRGALARGNPELLAAVDGARVTVRRTEGLAPLRLR